MRTKMRIKVGLVMLLLSTYVVIDSFAQEIPLVYSVENTGADCTLPPLPSFDELPVIKPLTDPFEWSDGSGRVDSFGDWCRRRAEIAAEIQHYEIGPKPERPADITASITADTFLTVVIVVNDDTLILTSNITLPEGPGPFPAVIGMGGGTGSLPQDIFTSRGIATIPFNYGQVMQWQQVRGTEPINRLYPDLTYMGAYSAWPWGVSRLIDGLELVASDLPIDLHHLAVTGCSFAGKMALFAGAFDERIALTIPQESGGGGAAAWRVSETLSGVENLGSTNFVWFMESMRQFSSKNVSKLPHDHHELMAMVAPRALFVIGNPSQVWLAEESGYTSCRAAKLVWDSLGIPDRMGFSFVTDHPHCALPDVEIPEVGAFVDKFLLGIDTVNTDISTNQYNYVIPEYWTDWWGTGIPQFAVLDRGDCEEVWFEAECATSGPAWNIRLDSATSNTGYIMPKPELESLNDVNSDSSALVYFPFTITNDTTFYLYGRLNCPTIYNDSYWMKLDDEDFVKVFGFMTDGWEWKLMATFNLTAGNHTIAFSYRKKETKLDKICISDFNYAPSEFGEPATTCVFDTTTRSYVPVEPVSIQNFEGAYSLGQNFPNPSKSVTSMSFEIPGSAYVSLKVFSILGEEVAELAGKQYESGIHTVDFDTRSLSDGLYFYTIKADKFAASRKMIIQAR